MSCLIGKSPENAGFNGKITHNWHLDYSISPVFPAHIRGSRSTGKKGDAERVGVARLEGSGVFKTGYPIGPPTYMYI